MGLICAEVKVTSGLDIALSQRHIIGEDEIKSMNARMLVDTGARMLCINENMQDYLQIPVEETARQVLANGEAILCPVVGPVRLSFENRAITCSAVVLPGDTEPLLGAFPIEAMDVVIDVPTHSLVVNPEYPDGIVAKCVSIRPPSMFRRFKMPGHLNSKAE